MLSYTENQPEKALPLSFYQTQVYSQKDISQTKFFTLCKIRFPEASKEVDFKPSKSFFSGVSSTFRSTVQNSKNISTLRTEKKKNNKNLDEDFRYAIFKTNDNKETAIVFDHEISGKYINSSLSAFSDINFLTSHSKKKLQLFQFDRVYDHKDSLKNIADESFYSLSKEMFSGISSLVFLFGPANSGKTYTLNGKIGKEKGIVQNVLEKLLDLIEISKESKNKKKYFININHFLIYNKKILDIIDGKAKKIEENENEYKIKGLNFSIMKSGQDLETMIFHSERMINEIQYQEKDSNISQKSHVIYKINLIDYQTNLIASSIVFIKLASSDSIIQESNKMDPHKMQISRTFDLLSKLCTKHATKGVSQNLLKSNILFASLFQAFKEDTKIVLMCNVSPSEFKLVHSLPALKFCSQIIECIKKSNIKNQIKTQDRSKSEMHQTIKSTFNGSDLDEFIDNFLILKEKYFEIKELNNQGVEWLNEMEHCFDSKKNLCENLISKYQDNSNLKLIYSNIQNILDDIQEKKRKFDEPNINIINSETGSQTFIPTKEELTDKHQYIKPKNENNMNRDIFNNRDNPIVIQDRNIDFVLRNDIQASKTTEPIIIKENPMEQIQSKNSISTIISAAKEDISKQHDEYYLKKAKQLKKEVKGIIEDEKLNELWKQLKETKKIYSSLINSAENKSSKEQITYMFDHVQDYYYDIIFEIIGKYKLQKDSFIQTISEEDGKIKVLEREIMECRKINEELKDHELNSSAELMEYKKLIEEQKESYTKMEKDFEELQNKFIEQESECNLNHKMKNDSLNKEILQLSNFLKDKESENEQLKNENIKKVKELNELNINLASYSRNSHVISEDNKCLKEKLAVYENNIKVLEDQNSKQKIKLKNSLKSLKIEEQEKSSFEEKFKKYQTIIENLEIQNQMINVSLESITKDKNNLKVENEELINKLKDLQKKLNELNSKAENSSFESLEVKKKILDMEQKKDTVNKQLELKINSLEKIISQQKLEAEQNINEIMRLKGENSQLSYSKNENEKSNYQLYNDYNKLVEENAKKDKEIYSKSKLLDEQNILFEQRIADINNQIDKKYHEGKKFNEAEKEYAKKLELIENEKEKLRGKYNKMKKENKKMKQKLLDVISFRLNTRLEQMLN